MPTSVRINSEENEDRYRKLADLQKLSLAEWIRQALEYRANVIQGWIDSGEFIDAGDKGYIFFAELPKQEADKVNTRKKAKGGGA